MIRFNIVFSLAVKALFLVLAIFGMTSLWLAILADTGATLLVVMNALGCCSPELISEMNYSSQTREEPEWGTSSQKTNPRVSIFFSDG